MKEPDFPWNENTEEARKIVRASVVVRSYTKILEVCKVTTFS